MPTPAELFQRFAGNSLGRRLFTFAVLRRAPYFASISPLVRDLRVGRCEVFVRNRRAVHNHIGSVHAIAMCNMCELAGGLMIDSSLPRSLRWIPSGMVVRYLKRATTDLVALAEWQPELADDFKGEVTVPVKVRDRAGEVVMEADIRMHISPRKP